MTTLLRRSSLRYARRHPLQTLLSIAGVALGIAVVLAIEIALGSARTAFELSTEALTGPATHQIVGTPHLDEETWSSLRPLLAAAPERLGGAPVVDGRVVLEAENAPAHSLRLLAVDPEAERTLAGDGLPAQSGLSWQGIARGQRVELRLEPAALVRLDRAPILLERTTAERLGLELGAEIALRGPGERLPAIVAGLVAAEEGLGREALRDTAFAPLAVGQRLLGLEGRLSRIDVRADDEALLERLRSALPVGAELLVSEARAQGTLRMARAFEINLRALSLLALLCGLFLVYNTVTFSVVQRRPWIGLLRALGVRRREVLGSVLGEVAVVAGLGTLLGIALGVLLATGLVQLVTRTLGDLYFRTAVRELEVPPLALLEAVLLGPLCSLLAALRPAIEATRVPPRRALTGEAEAGADRRRSLVVIAGVASLGVGGALLVFTERSLVASFAGMFLALVGFAALVPGATAVATAIAEPLLRHADSLPRLLVRGVRRSLDRTGVAIAALAVAIAVTVGIGVMVDSFRGSVAVWLGSVLGEDIYVTAYLGDERVGFDREAIEPLRDLPGVAKLHTVHHLTVEDPEGRTELTVLDFDRATLSGYPFLEGSLDDAWPAICERAAVLISEPLAFHRGVGLGDRLALPTDRGVAEFEVLGVYRDYASDRGEVLFHRDAFERWFDDDRRWGASIQAEPTADLATLEQAVRARLPDHLDWQVRSSARLRSEALAIFDRTFVITSVLRLLAGLVAFLGVVSALLALQLERRHELATLRALGYTRSQLRRLVLGQTALLGGVAGALSIPLGLALAAAMVFFVNRRSFGWTMELALSPAVAIEALLLALVAALLAGLYPAHRVAATPPAEALRAD